MIWYQAHSEDDAAGVSVAIREWLAVAGGPAYEDRRADLEHLSRALGAYLEVNGHLANGLDWRRAAWPAAQALVHLHEGALANRLVMFTTGVVRAVPSDLVHQGTLYAIDLTRLVERRQTRLEIVFYPALRRLLGVLAPLWDPDPGRGLVGLNGTEPVAAMLAGANEISVRSRRRRVADIRAFCRSELENLAAARHWAGTPQLIDREASA